MFPYLHRDFAHMASVVDQVQIGFVVLLVVVESDALEGANVKSLHLQSHLYLLLAVEIIHILFFVHS